MVYFLKKGVPRMKNRTRAVLYVTAGIAALAGLLFGYDTGVISGAEGKELIEQLLRLPALMKETLQMDSAR